MLALSDIETARLELQARLDSAKTKEQRNRLGQFATPSRLATDILECAKLLLPSDQNIRFLDPALGTGSFYSALLRSFPSLQIACASGYEIDSDYASRAVELWRDTPLAVNAADFTHVEPPGSDEAKSNLLICNPPYVRHHHIPTQDKLRLQYLAQNASGVRLSGLSGLYCYFLCISHAWMAENGLAGWLVPSEFMDVNYGQAIREYLLNRVTLLRIHRFDPAEAQFDDALVSSAVVWLRNALPANDSVVEFTYGGSLLRPRVSKRISNSTLCKANKWTQFLSDSPDQAQMHSGPTDTAVKLSDLFRIHRGLVTGANQFFILTPELVAKYDIPAEFLIPILPSSRYLPTDEIQSSSNGEPLLDRKSYLLSCSLPENRVRESYPSLWKYLQIGVATGINKRYLCRHRSPWYAQEDRPASMFLCTYMGRRSTGNGSPFRFLLNHSNATAPNVYLMLYPKPPLAKALKDNPSLARYVWQSLNEIPVELLLSEGRVYGGGLYKLEPGELGGVTIQNIDGVIRGLLAQGAVQQKLFTF